MKKLLTLLCVLALVVLGSDMLMAGSWDYLSNQSAQYIRTLNRNHADDAVDAVAYNPAALAMMKNGFYVDFSTQYLFKEYEMKTTAKTYKQDEPTQFLPNLHLAYKMDQLAVFAAYSTPAGGGKLKWDNGIPDFASLDAYSPKVEQSSVFYAVTGGLAYALSKEISLALGYRYLWAEKEIKASTTGVPALGGGDLNIKVTKEADNGAPIIGLALKPMADLSIGLRYEFRTNLKYKTKVTSNNTTTSNTILGGFGLADGDEDRFDLPAVFGTGIAYNVMPELRLIGSFQYYYLKEMNVNKKGSAQESGFCNGYEWGFAAEYKLSDQFTLSLGYNHSRSGAHRANLGSTDIWLNANSFGLGGKFVLMEGLNLDFGFAWTAYEEGKNTAGTVKYNKDVKTFALGIEYMMGM